MTGARGSQRQAGRQRARRQRHDLGRDARGRHRQAHARRRRRQRHDHRQPRRRHADRRRRQRLHRRSAGQRRRCSSAPATTRSSGIRATATTPSKVRPALDTLLFNGANIGENIDISANGERARFFRDVATVTMDMNDVEHIRFNALGGADNIVVGDMTGTDVTQVTSTWRRRGGAVGDGQKRRGDGQRHATAMTSSRSWHPARRRRSSGLRRQRSSTRSMPTTRSWSTAWAATTRIDGPWRVIGAHAERRQSASTHCSAASKTDLVNGGDGNDVALLGAGDDIFVWNPGDDNDTVEGQAGIDTLLLQRRRHRRDDRHLRQWRDGLFLHAISPTSPWI